jgi:hypothetical protein
MSPYTLKFGTTLGALKTKYINTLFLIKQYGLLITRCSVISMDLVMDIIHHFKLQLIKCKNAVMGLWLMTSGFILML